ncbi:MULTISPECIES: FAD/NAD(P)-binding protein [Calothrix]|uniref:FAD/NAD(P)-binding protein n=2 Tax=Calothrix TaxID=1186 RepID=A0ABR8AKH9_9CYAN|nr:MULTISPECIES: FAD/NAD(P)-binding protein [Calothrix]MBD2200571.1 FAD/NAD(P)-binding protein [Calothrix parietina FACHB-288]MBD2229609.1 FAD/NAD(P)-binding protein [Calothrix anomala FACHB-343]
MYNYILNQTVSPSTIAIIGGGFSGSLVAANILRHATIPLSIKLIERRTEIGKGVAYSTPVKNHLLNVPAGKMSAFADKPKHFLKWLHQNGHTDITASTFVPRQVYGEYIQAILNEAEANAPAYISLERIGDEAIAIETSNYHTKIQLSSGKALHVQKVVLALGNLPASLPQPIAALGNNHPHVKDAWASDAISNLNSDDSLLLVGTGLTMVDVVVALKQQGFRGKIHAISRHGLTPQRHQATIPYFTYLDLETAPKTARGLLHLVRQEIHTAAIHGYDWRAVIDAIRPISQQLWQTLPIPEQKRFLRHVKAYWEVYRHRIAPEIADVLDNTVQSAQLNYYGGRIQTCQEKENAVEVKICERGTQANIGLQVNRIINCTGANCNYKNVKNTLIANLQAQGLIRPHALSMGMETAANGAVIDADGKVSEILYTLGTPRKGDLWETTAVPEIRLQAAALAQELLKSLNPRPYAMARDWFAGNPLSDLPKPAMLFRQLYDRESSTYTYLIADPQTKAAILVDPVLEQVERDLQVLQKLDLTLLYCLETHIHADHITGTGQLRQFTGCLSVLPDKAKPVPSDRYITDSEILQLGSVQIQAIATPGHTDSHMAYLVNGTHLLTGDALFIGGCGRTDFQNGDAGLLYDVVTQKLFTLPDDTWVFPGHDYQGRTVSTIGEEKRWNPRFLGRTRSQFIELMNNLKLPYPQKMSEAVPANQRGGKVLVTLDYQI